MISLVNADSVNIPLADKSVQMIATSPPYWNLRDYGLGEWLGGYLDCDHMADVRFRDSSGIRDTSKENVRAENIARGTPYGCLCKKCGATRSNPGLGLESLHDCLGWARGENCGACYVCRMRLFGAECWRVLRDDGVMFLNLGDSYAASKTGFGSGNGHGDLGWNNGQSRKPATGLKPKDLAGIPWRVALALQADGWYLRSDIIWAKSNPMPESVTDRPTKAHEYIFLLTKRERYYYDQDAIREGIKDYDRPGGFAPYTANGSTTNGIGSNTFHQMSKTGRNKRTVWGVNTTPYPGAHFACWPPALVEPMIKAGSCPGSIVLDPFAGSGTTGIVARRLGRQFIGLDLSMDYLINQARTRLELDRLEAWGNGGIVTDDLDEIMMLPIFATNGRTKETL